MVRTLVVPLDGSQLAERALPFAIRLAQADQGRLVLMCVAGELEGAEAYLKATKQTVSTQVTDVEVAPRSGQPIDQIIESVKEFGADGVVMATHARTGLAHLVFGSVTEGLLARDDVPVCVVPARPGDALVPFSARMDCILVAQDGSANDETAVQTAVGLVGGQGELILVTVASPPEGVIVDESRRYVLAYVDQQQEAREREAREYLMSRAQVLRSRFPAIQVNVDVRTGDAVECITMAATDHNADLIVMATHGRTGIRRAVVGSVAGKVLSTATTPVVLVHPKQLEPIVGATVETLATSSVGPVPTF